MCRLIQCLIGFGAAVALLLLCIMAIAEESLEDERAFTYHYGTLS